MYLSIQECEMLDQVCDRFEVALRSYVSAKLTEKMDKTKFVNYLNNLSNNFNNKNDILPVNAGKYSAKAKSMASPRTYILLENSNKSLYAKEIIPSDVISVGDLVDLLLLFFNPLFAHLGLKFDSIEHFVSLVTLYHQNIRNKLAHPASAKISREYCEQTMILVSVLINEIPEEFFWYSSKTEILSIYNDLLASMNNVINIRTNLYTIPKKHSQLLLRDKEINDSISLICGESEYGRVSGSLELHGYGGVGKTTLVYEFCEELIRRELNNQGSGYHFILWLSSKTEELTYKKASGTIYIKDLVPQYTTYQDVITQVSELLEIGNSNEQELMKHIINTNTKGLIILDNLETISQSDKQQIKSFIKRSPRNLQFILTSRNFENIAEDDLPVEGFSDTSLGKQFINEYCRNHGREIEFESKTLEKFLRVSFGNTLILVLGLQRILDGTCSMGTIIEELQIHQGSEVEQIVEFMYKNTFDTAISEIRSEGHNININKLLATILLYDERIDFHSLRELLEQEDSNELNYVLEKLIINFVINKTEGYYELHEFAQKFVVLKLLPDDVQLKDLQTKIRDYKNDIKENLKSLYEARKTDRDLDSILDDWKPVTEPETIAISQAYAEHKKVRADLDNIKEIDRYLGIIAHTTEKFRIIEKRSFHPYICFQKARALSVCESSKWFKSIEPNDQQALASQILSAYDQSYLSINLKHKFISSTESYPAFLWFYGINLMKLGIPVEAVRILEESTEKYSSLKKVRDKRGQAEANTLLLQAYCYSYLKTQDERYIIRILNAIPLISKLRYLSKKEGSNKEIRFYKFFAELFLGRINTSITTERKLFSLLQPLPPFLIPLAIETEKKLAQQKEEVI